VTAFAAVTLSGCSSLSQTVGNTIDTLNPFTSSPKVKMAELEPIKASVELRLLWQGSAGDAGAFVFTPAIVGNSVYTAGYDGNLSRFDNGKQVWRVSAEQKLSGGVGADGKRVAVATSKGDVIVFDADGKLLWKTRVSSEVLSAPLLAGDLVIVRSVDSRIFALDAADGKRRWVYQRATTALSLRSNAGVVLADKLVLAGFSGGKLVAVSLGNGAAMWEATVALPRGATELERIAEVTSAPAVTGREVCAAAYQGRVACFDLVNGNGIWARDISSSAGLAADERYVFVSDDKGAIHAFDRSNGASIWKQDKLFMRGVSRPVIIGNYVAVGDAKGVVHLLRREDGAFAARINTDSSAISAEPQLSEARGLIVQTRNGGLYALGL